MKYRVQFKFNSMMAGYYYSEWFDTLEEAKNFNMFADQTPRVWTLAIEDENGEVV